MTMKEAMAARHTVRHYLNRALPEQIVNSLAARIDENNQKYGLHMQLITENKEAFGPILRLILAKGVRNYIILAGQDRPGLDEKIGYSGADLMLYAQTLGLNTWWGGGTFSKSGVKRNADLKETERILGVIAVGYGAEQGTAHKSKKPEEISRYKGTAPQWFCEGVRAVLLAPTALNRQAFEITGEGETVMMRCDNGAFSGIDLGIGKYHFEIGAGKDSFCWG